MKKLNLFMATAALLSSATTLAVETSVSGFGSIIGTTLLGDEGYWVKHPSGAGYYGEDSSFEIREESLLGIQGIFQFDDRLSVTAQVVSRGQDDWDPSVEQFFVSYNVTDEWNVKLGKLRNPVYMYSDSMDIHYSFGWLRTPGTSYSLSANFLEGVSAMYTGSWGDISNRTIVYYGETDKSPDPFLTELFVNRKFKNSNGSPLTKHLYNVKDLYGITTEFYYESWTAHFAFMETGGNRGTNLYEDGTSKVEKHPWRDFYDVAVSYDDGDWFAIAEWNEFTGVYSSYYVSAGKYWESWQFLLTYGEFKGELKLENGFVLPKAANEHTDSLALTARYDIAPGMAFKTELIMFNNEGSLIVNDVDGDKKIESTVLSIAFDFVF